MSRVNFTEIHTGDAKIDQLQSNIRTAISPLLSLPFADGVHKTDVALGTSDTLVDHGLGRKFVGYIITKQNADTSVFESSTTNNFPDVQMILKAGATVTVDLFFF
jgi:hypothetical protein|tara:strand:+ start:285 stop:599 length:315 start_codon:yes stop_codon:yes gene_type:complete